MRGHTAHTGHSPEAICQSRPGTKPTALAGSQLHLRQERLERSPIKVNHDRINDHITQGRNEGKPKNQLRVNVWDVHLLSCQSLKRACVYLIKFKEAYENNNREGQHQD
jgi:hypothetical protein